MSDDVPSTALPGDRAWYAYEREFYPTFGADLSYRHAFAAGWDARRRFDAEEECAHGERRGHCAFTACANFGEPWNGPPAALLALIEEHERRERHNESVPLNQISDLQPEPTSADYRAALGMLPAPNRWTGDPQHPESTRSSVSPTHGTNRG